jgi:hypothetical protein
MQAAEFSRDFCLAFSISCELWFLQLLLEAEFSCVLLWFSCGLFCTEIALCLLRGSSGGTVR